MHTEEAATQGIAAGAPRAARDGKAADAAATSPGQAFGFPECVDGDAWLPLYRRLRARARAVMAAERAGHTLEPTALVHEAIVRIAGNRVSPRTAEEYLAAGAVVMRRILVDWARRRKRYRRGGHLTRVEIAPERFVDPLAAAHVVAVDVALDRLERVDPEAALIVVLKHFGSLTIPECARVTGHSPRTVNRLWAFARSWLLRELDGPPGR